MVITSVAGFSGVGKSSLLSTAIDKKLETGKVSDKISRGRHTTRHVELFAANGWLWYTDALTWSKYIIPIVVVSIVIKLVLRKKQPNSCF